MSDSSYIHAETAASFNDCFCFSYSNFCVEVMMKHFRLWMWEKKRNNDSLFLFILCARPICSPRWIMPPAIQTGSNRGDSHLHHEQTQGKWCKKNTCAYKHYTLFLLLYTENNEEAYQEGNFTDLIQSQVPTFKSV